MRGPMPKAMFSAEICPERSFATSASAVNARSAQRVQLLQPGDDQLPIFTKQGCKVGNRANGYQIKQTGDVIGNPLRQ